MRGRGRGGMSSDAHRAATQPKSCGCCQTVVKDIELHFSFKRCALLLFLGSVSVKALAPDSETVSVECSDVGEGHPKKSISACQKSASLTTRFSHGWREIGTALHLYQDGPICKPNGQRKLISRRRSW